MTAVEVFCLPMIFEPVGPIPLFLKRGNLNEQHVPFVIGERQGIDWLAPRVGFHKVDVLAVRAHFNDDFPPVILGLCLAHGEPFL